MKVSIAVVKLFLRTSKKLADGSSPIRLKCCWNGTKEISTGYSCTLRFWDKRNECVKKGYPNYVAINAIISKMKMEAIERRDEFERKGTAYTPEMVLKPKEVVTIPKDDLQGLISRYTSSLSPTTCKTWKAFWNSFKAYIDKDNILVGEIDLDTVMGYAKHLEDKKLASSTIKMTLSKLAAILKYAVEEGIIKESPFKRFNYGKKYKLTSSDVYVHHRTIEVMQELFLNDVIVQNGKMWHYKDDSFEKMIDRTSDIFPRYFWLLGLLFAGLAPIDLCQLKLKDLQPKTIEGEDYYCVDIKRQKTNMEVHLRIKANTMYSNVMIKTLLMFRKGEYLLPVLDGVENDRLKIYKKVSNFLSNHTKNLREWAKEVNAEIIRRNMENKDNIPLIPEDITFYTYRHSFAQMYLAKGGNILNLASLLGRSMDTISTYVQQLSRDSDLVKAVSII